MTKFCNPYFDERPNQHAQHQEAVFACNNQAYEHHWIQHASRPCSLMLTCEPSAESLSTPLHKQFASPAVREESRTRADRCTMAVMVKSKFSSMSGAGL